MPGLLSPSTEQLVEAHLDITAPRHSVSVEWNETRTVLWVHVDGVTVLRVCRIPQLEVQAL